MNHDYPDPGAEPENQLEELTGARREEPETQPAVIPLHGDESSGEYPPAESRVLVKPKAFEDLTLAQALSYLILRPVQTARQLWQVLMRDPDASAVTSLVPPVDEDWSDQEPPPDALPDEEPPDEDTDAEVSLAPVDFRERERLLVRIGAMMVAVLLALRGGHLLQSAAIDPVLKSQRDTNDATFWFLIAGVIYVGAELWLSRNWWVARFPRTAGWIRALFETNPYWNAALIVPLIISVLLLIIGGGTLFTVLVLALIGLLWLVLLMGRTPPGEDDLNRRERGDRGEEQADADLFSAPSARSAADRSAGESPRGFLAWLEAHTVQLLLVPPALFFSALTYGLNVARDPASDSVIDVVITPGGLIAWVASVVLWIMVLAVDARRLREHLEALAWGEITLPRLRWAPIRWVVVALVAITLLGAVFRLYDLSSVPPEMTSDHIEKLLDALRVSEGYHGIFFPNNGGREGFQMYLVALIAGLPGVGFSFDALKLATVIEGLVTLPALWWMARQVIGTDDDERRRLADWTGIALAGLVAISSWHVMLSRLGLRIVLTPLTTALAIGFLARAMRHNRMRDYIMLGLVLGAGTYFYQANRMLPVLAVIGIGLALLSRAHRPREVLVLLAEVIGFAAVVLTPLAVAAVAAREFENSADMHEVGTRLSSFLPLIGMAWFSLVALAARGRRGDPLLQYGSGLLTAAVVALALYIPMYHYAEINPEQFWNRTRGRMFGEQAFVRTDPQTGELKVYEPSLREQTERLWDQRRVFEENYEDALLMFHWEGDVAWINDPHAYPALDGAAGGLLILGLLVWGVWIVRRRDPALGLLPAGVLIMLLPSAMTVAYTIENPSFTRASGTLPEVFMLAALPLGVLCGQVSRLTVRAVRGSLGVVVALAMIGSVLWYGIGWNWERFFTDYRLNYSYSWKPYTEIARPLRDFAQGEGSYGNAFVVAYPHWLDHRILGTMAGDIHWPNGLVNREDLLPMIQRNAGTPYQYDPAKPLYVMYNVEDTETAVYLDSVFPGGEHTLYDYHYGVLEPGYTSQGLFYIFTVQAGELIPR